MKTLGLKLLAFFGLVGLVSVVNLPPILMIRYQERLNFFQSWLLVVAYLVFVSLVVTGLWYFYRQFKPEIPRFNWGDIGYGFIWFLAARVVAILGTLAITFLSGKSMSANDTVIFDLASQLKTGFLPFALTFVFMIGMVAPVVEELIFRGIMLEFVFKQAPKWLAGLLTSLVFGLLHATIPLEILMYTGLGAIFYIAYDRRGTVFDSILVHFLNNLLGALVILFMIFF